MISKKINYFITLAECLSFTQTAARYEVTQTAVSQYIASLEERIGVRLFDRSRHSVKLSEAGKYYYQHVKSIISDYDAVLDHTRALSAGFHGSLKVGVGMYEYRSTEALFSSFLTAHPEIRVDILQYPYTQLIEKLKSGELDVIIADSICEGSFAKRELCTRTLFSSANTVVAEEQLALRNDNDVVKMMRNECLITNCESEGPSSMAMLNSLLRDEFGFLPEKISQTNSINAQLMLVRARHGIAIVPEFIAVAQCPDFKRFPLPGGYTVSIKLMYLSDCENEAADLLFNFEA